MLDWLLRRYSPRVSFCGATILLPALSSFAVLTSFAPVVTQFAYAESEQKKQFTQDFDPFQYDIKTWEQLANEGDAEAQFILGLRYVSGAGVPQDYDKAFFWYQKAAIQGHANAQYNLAHLYLSGDGVSSNVSEAIYWWKQAAQQGHVRAQYNLGYVYYRGLGIEKNNESAISWLKLAADQNDRRAMELLKNIESNVTAIGTEVESSDAAGHAETPGLAKDGDDDVSRENGPSAIQDRIKNAKPLDGDSWLFAQPQHSFTVQLISSDDRQSIESFIEARRLQGMVQMFQTKRNAREWWYLLFGSYASRDDAIEALKRVDINVESVWIRKIGGLQEKRCQGWLANDAQAFARHCAAGSRTPGHGEKKNKSQT